MLASFKTSLSKSFTRSYAPLLSSRCKSWSAYQSGEQGTLDYKVYIKNSEGSAVSTVHDIPLHESDKVFNMVVEVPRWSNAKLEMSAKYPFNPIIQDSKKGQVRYVRNVFPYKGYIHNYGAFPQTWEDPAHVHPSTGFKGDGDPLDVCEIGQRVGTVGEVKQVKVLGCLALIDEGETDWKVIAIDTSDPLATKLNKLADVEEHFPGLLEATHAWFRDYKVPDGKPQNQFAFEGKAKDAEFALDIISECHESWRGLLTRENEKANYDSANISFEGTKGYNPELGKTIVPEGSSKVSQDGDIALEKWYFV